MKGRAKLDDLLAQGRALRKQLGAEPRSITPGPELGRRLRELGYTDAPAAEPK